MSGSQKGSNLRLKCYRIRLAGPDSAWTRWGSLSAPTDQLAAIRGLLLREKGREGREGMVGLRERKRGEGREEEERARLV